MNHLCHFIAILFMLNGAFILFATNGIMLDFAFTSSIFGLCFFVIGCIYEDR